jgi:AraC-like DNA-binding protein
MQRRLDQEHRARLEGLCGGAEGAERDGGRIAFGESGAGIERMAARFSGQAFSPHRHDTYAVGVTLSGVQTFRYRGEQRICLPGECHVLHPDETHDGGSATGEEFSYRIAYVDPALIQQAVGARPLPFVADPVVRAPDVARQLLSDALDMQDPIDDVRQTDIAIALAAILDSACGCRAPSGAVLPLSALLRVHDLIATKPETRFAMPELERIADLDRWTLARQFRAAFGTSPSRFRTMRQLDRARRLLRSGLTLAATAAEAGFADQSHMTRLFKRAYGLTPGRWLAAVESPES